MNDTGSATLAFLGLRVRAIAPAADLEWLGEFLEPAFVRQGGGPPSSTGAPVGVSLTRNAEEHARLSALEPVDAGVRVGLFSLDRGMIEAVERAGRRRVRVFHHVERDVFYRVARDGSEVDVVTRPGDAYARFAWMRAIRELAMVECRFAGAPVAHAAAFAVDGHAVVAAGPKRSGKTSLLLRCSGAAGVTVLSNDRVALVPAPGHVDAHGMPTLVSVRANTLTLLPPVGSRLVAGAYDHRASLREQDLGLLPRRPAGEGCRIELTPAQLTHALSLRPVGSARAALLLFLDRTPGRASTQWVTLSHEEAAARLETVLCADGVIPEVLRPPGRTGTPPSLRPACEAVVRRLRCFSLSAATFGEDGAEHPALVDQIRARVREIDA